MEKNPKHFPGDILLTYNLKLYGLKLKNVKCFVLLHFIRLKLT